MESQKQKILNLLENGNWICTSQMYASFIADPRKRICELKEKGFLLEWRWCKSHQHKKSKEWHLVNKEKSKIEVKEYYDANGFIQKRTFNGVEVPISSMEKNFEIIKVSQLSLF